MFDENWDEQVEIESVEGESTQLGDQPEMWKVFFHVHWTKRRIMREMIQLEGEVSSVM